MKIDGIQLCDSGIRFWPIEKARYCGIKKLKEKPFKILTLALEIVVKNKSRIMVLMMPLLKYSLTLMQ